MSNDDLSPTVEDLVTLLRRDVEPIPSEARAQLGARLAGASMSPPPAPNQTARAPGRFWQSSKSSVALALPIGVLLGAAGYAWQAAPSPRAAPQRLTPGLALELPSASPRRSSSDARPSHDASPTASSREAAAPLAAPRATLRAPNLNRAAASTSASASGRAPSVTELTASRDDLELLERARSAFAEGDAPGSLARLSEHERRYPSSVFEQEREALTVKALVALGRSAEASRLAEQFLIRHPRSALAPSVARAVGKNP